MIDCKETFLSVIGTVATGAGSSQEVYSSCYTAVIDHRPHMRAWSGHTHGMVTQEQLETENGLRPRRRRVIRVALSAVVVVGGLVGGGVAYDQWSTHPDLLAGYNASQNSLTTPVGREFVGGLFLSGTRGATFDITKVRPHVVTNTAGATITLVPFKHKGDIGSDTAPAGSFDYLGSVLGPWTLSADSDMLYVITPHHPGLVQVDGVYITYRAGHRHQTQLTGISVKISAIDQ